MLNSRSLLRCINDPINFDAMTPNEFIIKKFDNFSLGDFNEEDISSRKKFISVQSNSNEFCRRFIKEYITSLNKQIIKTTYHDHIDPLVESRKVSH